jgi:DNA-binding transcriptional LysR family regulator
VAAPAYLATHRPPRDPADLLQYDCIRLRKTNGLIHPWEFEKDGEKIAIDVDGAVTGNNVDFVLRATLSGVGIAYLLEEYVAPYLAAGSLVRVLPDWSLPFAGYHLFYPSRRYLPAKLRAFIDFMHTAARAAPARLPVLATIAASSRITAALAGTELLPGVALPDYVDGSALP